MNIAVLPDRGTTALFSKPIYKNKMTAGALYRAELASQLEQRLGLCCDPKNDWFEVRGVPEALCQVFSKRRAAIEKRLGELGLETASAAAFAALATREAKGVVAPREHLFAQWQALGEDFGFTRNHVQALLAAQNTPRFVPDPAKLVQDAAAMTTKQHSHFAERDLLGAAAKLARGQNVDAVRRAVSEALRDPSRFVFVGELKNEKRYTTLEMFQTEKRLLETAKRLSASKKHVISAAKVEKVIDRYSTALQRFRPAPAGSYLGPAPRLRLLKHPPDKAGTGYHPDRRSPSPVSGNRHPIGHVA
jgi:hypothetical protein